MQKKRRIQENNKGKIISQLKKKDKVYFLTKNYDYFKIKARNQIM